MEFVEVLHGILDETKSTLLGYRISFCDHILRAHDDWPSPLVRFRISRHARSLLWGFAFTIGSLPGVKDVNGNIRAITSHFCIGINKQFALRGALLVVLHPVLSHKCVVTTCVWQSVSQ